MKHPGTQILKTDELILRPFVPEDAQVLFDNWACDPEVTRWLTWQPHPNVQATRQLLQSWCAEYARPDYYNWVLQLEDTVIGNISVVQLSDRLECAVLGWCMGRRWWNRGLMTQAARAVLKELFETAGLHRIEAQHIAPNLASGRVMQKCGMVQEGVQRRRWKMPDGHFEDEVAYAILREDWEAQKTI